MPISFRCHGCQKAFSVPDSLAGKKARCTACGAEVTVPGGASLAPASVPKSSPGKSVPAKPAPELSDLDDIPLPTASAPARPRRAPASESAPKKPKKKQDDDAEPRAALSAGTLRAAVGGVALVVLVGVFIYVMSNRQRPHVLVASGPATQADAPVSPSPPTPTVSTLPSTSVNPQPSAPVPVQPTTPVPTPNPLAKTGAESLLGEWVMGQGDEDDEMGQVKMTFLAEGLKIKEGRREMDWTYQIDASKTPKEIDLHGKSPDGKANLTIPGIFDVSGNELKIAAAFNGGARPIDFSGQALVLRRPAPTAPGPYPLTVIGREMPWVDRGSIAIQKKGNLAAIEHGGDILLWDLSTNRKVGEIREAIPGAVNSLAFSDDGLRLAAASGWLSSERHARVWDVSTKRVVASTNESKGHSVAISADGSLVAVAGAPTRVFNGATLAKVHEFLDAQECAFSPDGSLLALARGDFDPPLQLVDPKSGQVVAGLKGKTEQTQMVAFHPGGKILAVADGSGLIEFWDVAAKMVVKQWKVQTPGQLRAIAFSPDGTRVAAGNDPVQIWDFAQEKVVAKLRSAERSLYNEGIAFDATGKKLGVANPHVTRLWSLDPPASTPGPAPFAWPPALSAEQEAELRAASCLQQVSLGIANWNAVFRKPLDNLRDKAGQPIISWRAHLLPYLEQRTVYEKIKQDEPWDSPTNAQTPAIGTYAASQAQPGMTRILLATGPSTAFEGAAAKAVKNSGAIMLVLVAPDQAVPWLAPRDFTFNPGDPWSGLPKKGFLAVLWSGAVRFVTPEATQEELKALFDTQGEPATAGSVGAFDRFLWP